MNIPSADYDALIFDMDGVIIDSKEQVEKFWREKLDLYGIEIDESELEVKFHGRPARLIIDDLFSELSVETRSDMAEECARYDASVMEYSMISGVEDFLGRSAEAGFQIGLVTSAMPPKIERMLEGLESASPFHTVVSADLVQNGKPDPECYLLAAANLGLEPERTLVFEDSLSGVRAATGAGATVIGINEHHLADFLKQAGADLVMPDFRSAELQRESDFVRFLPQKDQPEVFFRISSYSAISP